MSGPSNYVREKREAGARRRLEVAKLLRDVPSTTNKQLAKALNVSRNTITVDRKAIMEELQKNTLTETEQLRAAMVERLENLNAELERHRDGDRKLPISVVHEMLLVHRSLIELLGVRKPVVEKLEIKKRTVSFTTSIVSTKDGIVSEPKKFELTTNHLALREGNDES